MSHKRAFIFANGEIKDANRLRLMMKPKDILIAADGGLHHLRTMGLWPDVLIGDLDSVSPAEIFAADEHGIKTIRFPIHKNETDLQLAIDYAIQQDCTEIIIAAALGGRLDQTVGNIFLLSRPSHNLESIRLDDGVEEVFLIETSSEILGLPGDIVSLLPLGGTAYDVWTEELKYPLIYEKLFPDQMRGISNVMLTNHARVSLSRGILICIHSRQNLPVN